MSERVLAIVVCFNPKIEALSVALKALTAQVTQIVIVDNASTNRDEVLELTSEVSRATPISVLAQPGNLGLGAAHNVGIRYAEQHDFTHVLLLDQDSVPLNNMVGGLCLALAEKSKELGELVAGVGATYLNADNGSESFFVRFGWLKFRRQYCSARDHNGCVAADFLISSGCLIPLSAIEAIGYMDEKLFIDHVDTEWFLRARSKGYSAFGVCDAVMQHGLGEQTHRISLRRQRNVPQHKPFRYYYMFRNSIALYRRGYASGLWKWNDGQRLLLIAGMFGVWKAPRRQNLLMMFRGVWHGIKGINGPMPN